VAISTFEVVIASQRFEKSLAWQSPPSRVSDTEAKSKMFKINEEYSDGY